MSDTITHPTCGTLLKAPVQRAIVLAGLLYLLLPNILFLLGWVQPAVAVPLCLVLLIGAGAVLKKLPQRLIMLTRRDWVGFGLAMACGLLAVELISFHGHIQQAGDFYVRNPIYQTLIREDWPIFSERGEHFVYYFAHWLVPAFISKSTDILSPATLLFIWTWLGIVIALGLAFMRLKGRVLPFFIILCLLGSVAHMISFTNAPFLEWHAHNGSMQGFWAACLSVFNWLRCITYPAGSCQLYNTFNHAVPLLVLFCFVISKGTRETSLPFISTLVLTATPLGGVAILPLLLIALVPLILRKGISEQLKAPSLYCGLLFLPVIGMFFSRNESGIQFLLANSDAVQKYGFLFVLSSYLFNAACILLPVWYFIGRRLTMKTGHGLTAIFLCITLPLLFVGQANNELLFKGAWVMYVSLALLYATWWGHAAKRKKMLFALVLLLSSGMFLSHVGTGLLSLSFSEAGMQQNRMDEWEGHLNHPDHWAYRQFWVDSLPAPFLNSPGESFINNQR